MMRDKVSCTELEARIEEGTRVPGETSAVKACRGFDFFGCCWVRPSQRRICVSAERRWRGPSSSAPVESVSTRIFTVFRDETISV